MRLLRLTAIAAAAGLGTLLAACAGTPHNKPAPAPPEQPIRASPSTPVERTAEPPVSVPAPLDSQSPSNDKKPPSGG